MKNIIRSCFTSSTFLLFLLTITILPASCQTEDSDPNRGKENMATFLLEFSGSPRVDSENARTSLTRAGLEDDIHSVDVLSFRVDPADPTNIKKGTFFYRAQGTYNAATQAVQVQLITDPTAQTLVVVANARTQVNTLGAALGEAKENVMSRFLISSAADGSPNLAAGMPMWGEIPAQVINDTYGGGTPPTVKMLRSVSKFTLNCSNVSSHHFFSSINEVRLYNYRQKGRVTPDNYHVGNASVIAPTIPTGADVSPGNFQTLIASSSPSNAIAEGTQRSFYLFETNSKAKVSGNNKENATCLVVHITFATSVKGQALLNAGYPSDGYYRIDFKNYSSGDYLDIYRNYDYQITVEDVEGLPAATADEAYKGNHSLKCKIVPWNLVNENIEAKEDKSLRLSNAVFTFPGDPTVSGETMGTQTLTVSTKNTGGWRIENIPSWLNVSQTSGADGVSTNINLIVGVNPGRSARTASVNIIAGRLTCQLKISQPDPCGSAGQPKRMRIGNNDYYTYRIGGQCWMLENSREGTPDNILPPLPGKTEQRYLWSGDNFVIPSKTGIPATWRIPLYTDVHTLRLGLYNDAIAEKLLQKWSQPGVLAQFPTHDPHGEIVGPWPDRQPLHFYQGNMPVWETRQLPRFLSYAWIQQDNISAFWSHQFINNPALHTGVQGIQAADGSWGYFYLARMPIVIHNRRSDQYSSSLGHASNIALRPLGNVWGRVKDLLKIHETVRSDNGAQVPLSNGISGLDWINGLVVMKPLNSGRYWDAPYYDMPWRQTAGTAFYNAALLVVSPPLSLFTSSVQYARPPKVPSTNEGEFQSYPGVTDFNSAPTTRMLSVNPDLVSRTGLYAYLGNRLPLRFVRND